MDVFSDELLQFGRLSYVRLIRAIQACLGAGGKLLSEAVLLCKALDLSTADLHSVDIDLGEDSLSFRLAFHRLVGGGVQGLEQVTGSAKGIVIVRIDQQQGERSFIQEEPMNQLAVLLPGQVPE